MGVSGTRRGIETWVRPREERVSGQQSSGTAGAGGLRDRK